MRSHMRHVHSKTEDRRQCPQCELVCKNKYTLASHLASKHSAEEPRCDLCDYQAKGPISLLRHMRVVHEVFAKPRRLVGKHVGQFKARLTSSCLDWSDRRSVHVDASLPLRSLGARECRAAEFEPRHRAVVLLSLVLGVSRNGQAIGGERRAFGACLRRHAGASDRARCPLTECKAYCGSCKTKKLLAPKGPPFGQGPRRVLPVHPASGRSARRNR